MDEILPSLRNLLIDHLATSQALTANIGIGGTTCSVANTSRFRIGDECYLSNPVTDIGQLVEISDIIDDKTMSITAATIAFTTTDTCYIKKAIGGQNIRRVVIGGLKQLTAFPSITIAPGNESTEWGTLAETYHTYNVSIKTYVLCDNFEKAEIQISKLTKAIKELLLEHLRPIINGISYPLTQNLGYGESVIRIANTAGFSSGDYIFLRDAKPNTNHQEEQIKSVLSSTALEISGAVDRDYLTTRSAELIKVNRLLYDSRPESINYGYVKSDSGSLLRASEISWWGKEAKIRLGNTLT